MSREKIRIGNRIVIDGEGTDEFRGLKATLISKEVFLKNRPNAVVFYEGCFSFFRLDKKLRESKYWQINPKDYTLLSRSNYND